MDLTGLGSVFDFGSKVLDKIFPDPTERARAQAALEAAQAAGRLQELQADQKDEEERTKRQQADMASDNTLSKNVRPVSLIYLLLVTTILALTDGNLHFGEWDFQIKDHYISLFEALLLTAFGFYFSSRGLEKIADIIRSWKVK